jgi:hypothetical protein
VNVLRYSNGERHGLVPYTLRDPWWKGWYNDNDDNVWNVSRRFERLEGLGRFVFSLIPRGLREVYIIGGQYLCF